jgi:hypothetical protein
MVFGALTSAFGAAGFGEQPIATTRSNTHTTANVFFISLSFPNLAILPRRTLSCNKASLYSLQVKAFRGVPTSDGLRAHARWAVS